MANSLRLIPKLVSGSARRNLPKPVPLCRNEVDGVYAEEQIRANLYWTRFPETKGESMQVPDEVVIKDPNRNGAKTGGYRTAALAPGYVRSTYMSMLTLRGFAIDRLATGRFTSIELVI